MTRLWLLGPATQALRLRTRLLASGPVTVKYAPHQGHAVAWGLTPGQNAVGCGESL